MVAIAVLEGYVDVMGSTHVVFLVHGGVLCVVYDVIDAEESKIERGM